MAFAKRAIAVGGGDIHGGGGGEVPCIGGCYHFPKPVCRSAASVFAPRSEDKIRWGSDQLPRIVLVDPGLLGCLKDIHVSM
jgi:hypothetical protein